MKAQNIDLVDERTLARWVTRDQHPGLRVGNVVGARGVRRRMTGQRLTITAALAALLVIAGCDPELDTTNTELRSISPISWSSVGCMTNGGTDRCYARTDEGTDFRIPVVSACSLAAKVESGEYVETDDGWYWSCDYGRSPETFTDAMCFHDSATHGVGFGGSDGGYTKVEPYCAGAKYNVPVDPYWPETACRGGLASTYHNYDGIYVVDGGTPWWGRAANGDDAFYGSPSCAIPTLHPAGNPYDC